MSRFQVRFNEMVRGASAYEVAVRNGYKGTEAEWVAELQENARRAEANAKQSEVNAEKSASSAAQSESNAAKSTKDANESAVKAAQSETNAETHEQNAANHAKVASQEKTETVTAANNAKTYAQNAADSAAAAKTSETDAEQATRDAVSAKNRAVVAEQNAAKSAEEAKKIANMGGMGGADWNAAEGEPGYVLNRTHWVEVASNVELPLVMQWGDMDGDGTNDMVVFTEPIGLEVGNTYVVNFGGTDYTVTGMDVGELSGGEMQGVFLGNLAMMGGEDNGAPFALMEYPEEFFEEVGCYAQLMSMIGEVEITITGAAKITHKLPTKFLDSDWVRKQVSMDIETAKDAAISTAEAFVTEKLTIPELDLNQYISDANTSFFLGKVYEDIEFDTALTKKIVNAGVVKVTLPELLFGAGRYIIAHPVCSGYDMTICIIVNGYWNNVGTTSGTEVGVFNIDISGAGKIDIYTRRIAISATV